MISSEHQKTEHANTCVLSVSEDSSQDYLYSAFYNTIVAKELYRKLNFYNRFIYCRNLICLTYGKMCLILYTIWGLASSEVLWGVGIISSQVFGHLRSFKGTLRFFRKYAHPITSPEPNSRAPPPRIHPADPRVRRQHPQLSPAQLTDPDQTTSIPLKNNQRASTPLPLKARLLRSHIVHQDRRKTKPRPSKLTWPGTTLPLRRNNQGISLLHHGRSRRNDIITSYLAGDYPQAPHHTTTPAAPMARQQSPPNTTAPSHTSPENSNPHLPSVPAHDATIEEPSPK